MQPQKLKLILCIKNARYKKSLSIGRKFLYKKCNDTKSHCLLAGTASLSASSASISRRLLRPLVPTDYFLSHAVYM